MEESRSKTRISTAKLAVILVIFSLIAVLIEAVVSIFVLRLDLKESTDLFLNQIENVIDTNEDEEQLQLEELKETYMTAAKAAAYIVAKSPGLTADVGELRDLAELLNVDEIHIFDKTGKIVGGTNPEYFGLDFDAGDQIAYFKPMLSDKTLSMCQDITPNTAEGKNMMYAITWDENGNFMVQVGVEPTRLLKMLDEHSIENVINSIPITEGYDIYVINPKDNIVVASSDKNAIGAGNPQGIRNYFVSDVDGSHSEFFNYDRLWGYSNWRQIGEYLIVITYNVRYSNNSLLVSIIILFAYLLLAGITLIIVVFRSHRTEDKKNEDIMKQYRLLLSMSNIYFSMYVIDLINDTFEEFKSQGTARRLADKTKDASFLMHQIMDKVSSDESRDKILKFTDLKTVADRMAHRKIISTEFISYKSEWFRASFTAVEKGADGKPTKVIYTTRNIDEDKRKEETLIVRSTTDELTGCYNRRAYEEMLTELERNGVPDDFAYISVDVNGLKATNDTFGHEAGDELIMGASSCLLDAFAKIGKVFRVGGDEFTVLLFTNEDHTISAVENFEDVINHWSGRLVKTLSISCGCVHKSENPEATIHEMAMQADKKMYEAKAEHYRMKGMDRRGQQDAHKALCRLYTKILRINLSDDSYQIVNMEESEMTSEKGFADRLSKWLISFGTSGQVHPDDLEEYLKTTDLDYIKNYFADNKTSLHIFYRRKFGSDFKKVMMEIIPANDYSQDNMNMFLYVKNIDK